MNETEQRDLRVVTEMQTAGGVDMKTEMKRAVEDEVENHVPGAADSVETTITTRIGAATAAASTRHEDVVEEATDTHEAAELGSIGRRGGPTEQTRTSLAGQMQKDSAGRDEDRARWYVATVRPAMAALRYASTRGSGRQTGRRSRVPVGAEREMPAVDEVRSSGEGDGPVTDGRMCGDDVVGIPTTNTTEEIQNGQAPSDMPSTGSRVDTDMTSNDAEGASGVAEPATTSQDGVNIADDGGTELDAIEFGTELDDGTAAQLGSIAKVRMVLRRARKNAKAQRVRLSRQRRQRLAVDESDVEATVAALDAEVQARRQRQTEAAYTALCERQDQRRTMPMSEPPRGNRAKASLVQSITIRDGNGDGQEAAATDGLPTAMMQVDSERRAVKLDSGARYSIAGTDWMKLGERKRGNAPVDFVEGIGGFLLDVLGVWTFTMRNAFGQVVQIDACIVDGCTDEFLVGVDFMKRHRATMDFSRNEIRYDAQGSMVVIPFRTEDEDGGVKVAAVRLVNSVQLRRDTVMPIELSVTARDGEEGVFLPTGGIGPVMWAATVTKVRHGKALVPVINLLGDKTKLPGRRELGVWIPIDADLEVLELNGAMQTDKLTAWLDELGDTATPLDDENSIQVGVEDRAERELVLKMLRAYRELVTHQGDCPPATALPVQHHIDTGGTSPIMMKRRRHAQTEDAIIEENVQKMLAAGVIEEGNGAWGFPVVLVRKKDGEIRFCIDYRALNSVTKRDVYPLPRIDETLETLGGATLFTTLDLKAGYWQIVVASDDRDKTAFTTKQGLYRFVRMPFGLMNAPSTFQRMMNGVLRGLTWITCLVYLDDIVIFTRGGLERHIVQVAAVLERLSVAGLTLKLKKCVFAARSMVYLGHLLSGEGVRPVERLTYAVAEFPRPNDATEVKRFVHLAGYYRKFVDSFGSIVAPLTRLLKKDVEWQWTEEQQFAFERVKAALTAKPLLVYPNFAMPFRVVTDASKVGLGACLMQDQGRGWQPIAYASKVNSEAESKYSITELECLAVVWAVKLFRPYVYGRRFEIVTDHAALKWLMTRTELAGRLHRWSLTLQEYEFEIVYRPGTTNVVADALSRAPVAVIMATGRRPPS